MLCNRIEFSGHAVRRMFERRITEDAVVGAILKGDVIAEYPDDKPYPSFLVLGESGEHPLHVVLGVEPASKVGLVITVYVPEPNLWSDDFRTRRTP